MPENFSFDKQNLIYVNGVRNFLVQAENAKNRKSYSLLFHIFYALVCSLATYLAIDGQSIGLGTLPCAFFLCLSPALYVFNFLYSPMPLKLAAILMPAAAFAIKTFAVSQNPGFISVAPCLFMYILCILTGAALSKVSLSGLTKSTCFIIVTVIYFIIIMCVCAFLLIAAKGTCSPVAAVEAIDGFFQNTINSTMDYAKSREGLAELTAMISSYDITEKEMLSTLEETLTLTAAAAKSSIPSALILSCMLFAFVTIELFSVFAKYFRIDVFVCIMDDFWTYRLSRATTMMYDIVFFAYILGMFIALPNVLSITVTNLLMIMTPVVFIPGVKSIHAFFSKKKMNKTASVILTCIIVLAAVMLTGMLGIYIISSIGVTYVITREMQESLIFPAKFASDCEEYKRRYGKEMPKQTADKENNDNIKNI